MSELFRKKSIDKLIAESEGDGQGHSLKRALNAKNLVTLGIGAIIGTGIFVLTGTAAAVPVSTNIPVPIIAPIPSVTRFLALSARLRE